MFVSEWFLITDRFGGLLHEFIYFHRRLIREFMFWTYEIMTIDGLKTLSFLDDENIQAGNRHLLQIFRLQIEVIRHQLDVELRFGSEIFQ
jgi:hypothetical protein